MGARGKADQPQVRRCAALNRKGEPCKARPMVGSDYCSLHADAGRAAELGAKGGKTFAPLATLETADYCLDSPQAVATCLSDCVNAVLTGRLDHRIGNTISALCGQLVRAHEMGTLEERLAALEAKLLGGKQ